jgi:hypothetical protein
MQETKKITEFMGDLPVSKKDAEKFVREFILSNYGNIPSIGEIIEKEDYYIVPVEVFYPKIILDEITNEPKKVRFLKIGKVGEIRIDKIKGKILDKPTFYDIRRNIRNKLEFVSSTIEKALVKIGAEKFSKLPFAAHMHTPFIDIFSWIIVNEKLELKDLELIIPYEDDLNRYLSIIETLTNLGLLAKEGSIIIPGNIFIGIEEKYKNTYEQLEAALEYFYREGYEDIDSIRWVLGPHLTLSRIIYEKSLEFGDILPLKINEINEKFSEVYARKYAIKLPRYLIQLESINIIKSETKGGEILWSGNTDIFNRLLKDPIIDPLKSIIE